MQGGVSEQELQPLTPYYDSGWEYSTNIGYYIHRGRVYVQGSVDGGTYASGGQMGSGTLLTGLPSDLCPPAATPVKLLIDPNNSTEDYAPDSNLHVGPFIDATVNPGGDVTFDGGNPVYSDPSSGLSLAFAFSWPLAIAVPDTYTPDSAAPYVGTAANLGVSGEDIYADIDATILPHDARLHLGGHVKGGSDIENTSGSNEICNLTPAMMADVLSSVLNGNNWTEIPSNNGYRLGMDTGERWLWNNGSLAPPAGNGGCGLLDNLFYSRWESGFIARGSDVGAPAECSVGFSSTPVSSLPSSASWDGMAMTVTIQCPRASIPIVTTGGGQLCYVIAGIYKVCLTLGIGDPYSPHHVVATVWEAGTQIGGVDLEIGLSAPDPTTFYGYFAISVSPHNFQVGGDTPGTVYFQFYSGGRDTFFTGTPGGPTTGVCGAGYGVSVTDAVAVNGLGHFPPMVPGDVLDFTNCGWGLVYAPAPVPNNLIPTIVTAGPGRGGIVKTLHALGVQNVGQFGNQSTFSLSGLVQLAVAIGFGSSSPIAAAVSMAESSGIVDNQNPSGAAGLWQILPSAHPQYDVSRLLSDPFYNGQAAYEVSNGGTDWTPWVTFTTGAYDQYLAQATAIYNALGSGSQSAGAASGGPVPVG